MKYASRKSWDYYHCKPYPQHAFDRWSLDKGPLPTPLGYTRILIDKGAEFLFRNGLPAFSLPEYPNADEFLQKVIIDNELAAQWVSLAKDCGNYGAIAAKFSYDADDEDCPVKLNFLSVPNECRIWTSPHDQKKLLMARIQYPYRDTDTGHWFWFREEWSDDEHATYEPVMGGDARVEFSSNLDHYDNFGDGVEWGEPAIEENPFGVLPITIIKNKYIRGNPLGVGDLWDLYKLEDRIALTMHGEDSFNQTQSRPVTVVTNGNVTNDAPLQPGEILAIDNADPNKSADVKLLEPDGKSRLYTQANIDKWEELLYDLVGLSRADPASIANKGNMTELALTTTFARSIATTEAKRKCWGEAGMSMFFANLIYGVSNVGGVKELSEIKEKPKVSVVWAPYFAITPQDKIDVTNRTHAQVTGGYLPHDMAIERIGKAEGLHDSDIQEMKAGLLADRDAAQAKADELHTATMQSLAAKAESPTNSGS